ncbi:hypothetical protein IQ06DRAFT_132361 [Phaeosphaeriaceae sp. SRC1lsM3a]|nr:hypothetical protein IQ06DRAFT_132361 [Stagonospora sp. SRC1lsM3a]
MYLGYQFWRYYASSHPKSFTVTEPPTRHSEMARPRRSEGDEHNHRHKEEVFHQKPNERPLGSFKRECCSIMNITISSHCTWSYRGNSGWLERPEVEFGSQTLCSIENKRSAISRCIHWWVQSKHESPPHGPANFQAPPRVSFQFPSHPEPRKNSSHPCNAIAGVSLCYDPYLQVFTYA